MIPIVRHELPEHLTGRLDALTAQLATAEDHQHVTVARQLWKSAPLRTPLRQVLGQMAVGRRFCMYCGDNEGTDIDHFDPIARNPLRTFDWLNHLLACSACNSHQKRDQFPIRDGRPLLIDPTAEDPFDHLLLAFSSGEYTDKTEKGEATIRVCGLNRDRLVKGRRHARFVVEMCLAKWQQAREDGDELGMGEAVFTIHQQPCADVCQAMLRYATYPTAEIVFATSPETLRLLRLPALRESLLIA